MNKNKTSIVFTGDIGFDRYMDKRWEDDNLLSKPVLDFFHSADHVVANVEGALIDAVDDGSRGVLKAVLREIWDMDQIFIQQHLYININPAHKYV